MYPLFINFSSLATTIHLPGEATETDPLPEGLPAFTLQRPDGHHYIYLRPDLAQLCRPDVRFCIISTLSQKELAPLVTQLGNAGFTAEPFGLGREHLTRELVLYHDECTLIEDVPATSKDSLKARFPKATHLQVHPFVATGIRQAEGKRVVVLEVVPQPGTKSMDECITLASRSPVPV
jgi:hypothetical protein